MSERTYFNFNFLDNLHTDSVGGVFLNYRVNNGGVQTFSIDTATNPELTINSTAFLNAFADHFNALYPEHRIKVYVKNVQDLSVRQNDVTTAAFSLIMTEGDHTGVAEGDYTVTFTGLQEVGENVDATITLLPTTDETFNALPVVSANTAGGYVDLYQALGLTGDSFNLTSLTRVTMEYKTPMVCVVKGLIDNNWQYAWTIFNDLVIGEVEIDWGNGETSIIYAFDGEEYPEPPTTFTETKEYTVKIRHNVPMKTIGMSDMLRLLDWGECVKSGVVLTDYGNESVLTEVPNYLPTYITDATSMMAWHDIDYPIQMAEWDTSRITNMMYMFKSSDMAYIPIENWNVSNVTNMNSMFIYSANFNTDISRWNTKNVTDMAYMFNGANAFNRPLGTWNVSKVTDMSYMFSNASSFNADISGWNTKNVTNMSSMFSYATAFNQPLNDWDVSNVTDMSSMFESCLNFNQSLNKWRPGKVVKMSGMFSRAIVFNGELNGWDTSNVTDMSRMFYGCNNFNRPLDQWDVSKVTTMENMFNWCSNFNQPLKNWNVGSLTNAWTMFYLCSNFNQDLDGWNTINLQNAQGMFSLASKFNGRVDGWKTENLTNVSFMFNDCAEFNKPLTGWHLPNVVTTRCMFQRCYKFNQPLNQLGLGNNSDFSYMFYNCTAFDQPLDQWDTRNAINFSAIFYGCVNFNQDISNWKVHNVTTFSWTFYGCTKFNKPLNSWDVSKGTALNAMFSLCSNFNQPLSDWNLASATNVDFLFNDCSKFNQPLHTWSLPNVTSAIAMFQRATYYYQDLSQWCVPKLYSYPNSFVFGTSLPTYYRPVWGTCPARTTGSPLSVVFIKENPSSAPASVTFKAPTYGTDQYLIAWGDGTYSSGVISQETTVTHTYSSIAKFNATIRWAGNYEITLPNVVEVVRWGSNATAYKLNSELLRRVPAKAPNVTNMNEMFSGAKYFNGDISSWDVSKVISMENMFNGAFTFKRDLSQWCVPLISTLPTDFATGATALTSDKQPVWGTCPRGENLV